MTKTSTLTAREIMQILGLSPKSKSAFLRTYVRQDPHAFVVEAWAGVPHPKQYDRAAFMRWLEQVKGKRP